MTSKVFGPKDAADMSYAHALSGDFDLDGNSHADSALMSPWLLTRIGSPRRVPGHE